MPTAAAKGAAKGRTPVTIWHNPKCGTSRKVLDMIRAKGIEPAIVDYVKAPPSVVDIKAVLAEMGATPRDLLRRRGTPYDELGLDDPARTDEELVDAILAHPILMERPVVVGPGGVRLCRPAERVQEVLPAG